MAAPLVRKRRELTRRAILLNPKEVSLVRKERVPYAGAWKTQEVTLPPQIIRLFISSQRSTRDVTDVGGQMQFNQYGLLAQHDADIRRGDIFKLDPNAPSSYRVERVEPVSLLGEVVSLQVTVVEVE